MASTGSTSPGSLDEKQARLAKLKEEVARLEAELASSEGPRWRGGRYYTAYYATTGFVLGMFAASVSLLFNVIGASVVGRHPLELIRVYLTFPLGERALQLESGVTLAIGCCLYLGTGMLFGMIIHLILTRLAHGQADFPIARRFLVTTNAGIFLWLVNYYGILSWLQPLLFGGNWIVERVPWWVGALTHLSFTWTMAVLYPLGLYEPYRSRGETDGS